MASLSFMQELIPAILQFHWVIFYQKCHISLVKLPSQTASSYLGGYIVPRAFSRKSRQRESARWEVTKQRRTKDGQSRLSEHLGLSRAQRTQEKCWELQSITNISFSRDGQITLGLTPVQCQDHRRVLSISLDALCRIWTHTRALSKQLN